MLNVYRTLTLILIVTMIETPCYADEVHWNGPVTTGGNESQLCLNQLIVTQKDLEKQKFERDIAVKEMYYVKNEEHSTGTVILWTVIGIAAGGAGSYLLLHKH